VLERVTLADLLQSKTPGETLQPVLTIRQHQAVATPL
jgi:hypothetical protein